MSSQVRQFVRGDAGGPGDPRPFILWGQVDEDGSCCGDAVACFEWEESGGYSICSLDVSADAFGVFALFPDVFAALGQLAACSLVWSVGEAAAFLVSLGFVEVL